MSGVEGQKNLALQVARYLVARAGDVTGKSITNLKLQKLAYYAQGFALALRNQPLFPEPVEAWGLGPVVRSVYFAYQNGNAPIHPAPEFDAKAYLPENRELLDAILATYGLLSPNRLSGMTHLEKPWQEAYGICQNTPLSLPTMESFFTGLVDASRRGERVRGYPNFPVDSLQHQRRRELSRRMERHREKLRGIALRPRKGSDPWADDED